MLANLHPTLHFQPLTDLIDKKRLITYEIHNDETYYLYKTDNIEDGKTLEWIRIPTDCELPTYEYLIEHPCKPAKICYYPNNQLKSYVWCNNQVKSYFTRPDTKKPSMILFHPNGNIRVESWYHKNHLINYSDITKPSRIIYYDNGVVSEECFIEYDNNNIYALHYDSDGYVCKIHFFGGKKIKLYNTRLYKYPLDDTDMVEIKLKYQ